MNKYTSGRKVETFIVIAFLVIYSLAAISVSLNRFWQYNAFWYDFGIFDSTVWKISRLQLPVIEQLNPPLGKIVWADHLNPSAIFVAPFYWVSSKAEVILIAQVLFVAASAGVGYLILIPKVKSAVLRVALVVSFLGYVGMQNALYTDAHNIVFAVLPLMLCLWALYAKKIKLYLLFLVIFLGFQENMAAVGAGLGLFLILRRERNIPLGIMTMVISLVYGLLAMKVIIPYFRGGGYAYEPQYPYVWQDWVVRLFVPFNLKLKTILATYATYGFLPLGAVAVIPLVVEHFVERFVLNTAATRWDLGFHYNALLSPIMFLGALETVLYLQKKNIHRRIMNAWGWGIIIMVVFLHRFYLHGPLMLATHPVFYQQTQGAQFLKTFVEKIPRGEGLIMTQNNLAIKFTHEKTVMLSLDYSRISPQVVAVDIRPGQNGNDFYPLNEEEVHKLVNMLDDDPKYVKEMVTDSQLIFRLSSPASGLPNK